MPRPERVILVAGAATGVGKTWVAARLAEAWRAAGVTVAARKPVQSFGQDGGGTDAHLLALATGGHPTEVCAPERWYGLAMAPPLAAEALGRPSFTVADLVVGIRWPHGDGVRYGLVEAVGGPRSPIAVDGDTVSLAAALAPDLVIIVADAGLGAINAVVLASDTLAGHRPLLFLNRFDASDPVHTANLEWFRRNTALTVVADLTALQAEIEATARSEDLGQDAHRHA